MRPGDKTKICEQCSQSAALDKFYRDQERKKPAKGDTICTSCWVADVEAVFSGNDVEAEALHWLVDVSYGFNRYSLFYRPRWRYLKANFYQFKDNEEYYEGQVRIKRGERYYLSDKAVWQRLIRSAVWLAIRTNGIGGDPTALYKSLRASVRVQTEARLLERDEDDYREHPELEFITDQEGGDQAEDDDLGTFGTYTSQINAKCEPIGMRTRHPLELGRAGRRELLPWAPYQDEHTNALYRQANNLKPLEGRTKRKRNRDLEKRNIPLGRVEPLRSSPALVDPTTEALDTAERQAELSLTLEELRSWWQEQRYDPTRFELLVKNYGQDAALAERKGFPGVNALHKWRHDRRKRLTRVFPNVHFDQ